MYSIKQYLIVVVFGLALLMAGHVNSETTTSNSTQCIADVEKMQMFSDFLNDVQMFTYSGRGVNDLGNIDGCLMLPSNVSHFCMFQSNIDIPGSFSMTSALMYTIGLCLPPSCKTTDEIIAAIQQLQQSAAVLVPVGNITNSHCYDNVEDETYKYWTTGAIVMLCVCVFFAFMVTIGTLMEAYFDYDMKRKRHMVMDQFDELQQGLLDDEPNRAYDDDHRPTPSMACRVFLAFSLITNYKSFFGGASSKSYFHPLDGIRTMSTCWVILGHSIIFTMFPGLDNLQYVWSIAREKLSFQVFVAGEFAVDVFFLLSGFLVAHAVLSQFDRMDNHGERIGPMFWLKYLLHRFLRLSPLMYFLLFFFWNLTPMMGSGPLWYQMIQTPNTCDKYWWTNLLYINNVYPTNMTEECFGWGWYLANDMQFFILAPFVFLAFRQSRMLGWSSIILLLAACFTSNIWVSLKYSIPTFFEFGQFVPTDWYQDLYQKPWYRMGPYVVGIAAAYLHINSTVKHLYKRFWIRWTIYLLAFGITFFFTYIPYTNYHGKSWNMTENALFNGFAHTMFPVGVTMFMLATFYGHGGIVREFLQLPLFRYLSKLTYSAYLIHPIVIFTAQLSFYNYAHYAVYPFTWLFTANLVISFACAFIVHLTIEKPFVNLERLLFAESHRSDKLVQ
ncbi:hypothetical protein SAMD00019534_087120 [Acytostelium subglobosum LB1]|uniref:hypothetical protein n=1 Tax=Acytostelium subglobosum LB1 TaxID=1410327 RepID=UPI000644B479|nr:hypothetical protein SAMD00019534_087120 [Acytostelium subglobosum LB1]GAM25537.1 hypothetical protein SAMD00019534_087120 [Acytostelium subglobosum LB1]|eukprot:XP_012751523.1 hypothetical protein SAMD00019534_087120 [Acytostelium subglobosum LB1]